MYIRSRLTVHGGVLSGEAQGQGRQQKKGPLPLTPKGQYSEFTLKSSPYWACLMVKAVAEHRSASSNAFDHARAPYKGL